jgi:hypothetical protein
LFAVKVFITVTIVSVISESVAWTGMNGIEV